MDDKKVKYYRKALLDDRIKFPTAKEFIDSPDETREEKLEIMTAAVLNAHPGWNLEGNYFTCPMMRSCVTNYCPACPEKNCSMRVPEGSTKYSMIMKPDIKEMK